jgi:[glutamine synthetase] adenylyltransferase / [glutamine synthetase]-adenylyl-L-tyrosine phosphorylase
LARFAEFPAEMDHAVNWIQKKAADSVNPSQVERTLLQIERHWPTTTLPLVDLVEHFPLGEAALLHLFAVSSVCATRLTRDPEILLWLQRPEVCLAPRSGAQMADDLHTEARDSDSIAAGNFRALRRWKGREMVRIAVREVADAAFLEETTTELSQIAEICIRRVFEYWNTRLRQQLGSPKSDFAILALGKLGGRELNHSSDVDLIFVYNEEGQLSPHFSYHQFFNRLGEKILESFSTAAPDGALLRIDLRLRPEGSAGPLARSLESMEHYYGGFGETWERLALIKSRGVAGNRELAYEFLRQLQPFVYPKSPTPDLLEEIAHIKRRIERDIVGQSKLGRDVKLGRGGIREIEFVVQTLQFVHGARHTFLQEPNTLQALHGLAELELIPRNEVVDLERAYRFLRRTEHRLQIEAEEQTHTVPTNPEQLRRLAASLGFGSADKFQSALEQEMLAVRAIFHRMIAEGPAGTEIGSINLDIFRDRSLAERAITDLAQAPSSAHISSRTRQAFRKLQPLLLTQLARVADPEATLTRLVRFAEAYGLRNRLFELLVVNPRLLELLVKTLDASRFAADLLVRRPQLLEEITRSDQLDQPAGVADHLSKLRSLGKSETVLDRIRSYRRTEILRILFRDLLGLSNIATICREQSALAEACLISANEFLGGENLTIVALGKFGGAEVNYGADLDVIFVGEETRSAQNLFVAATEPSSEGNIASLDARLRPDGEKGPLVTSLAACESYYRERAHVWEIHALTRARPISGPLAQAYIDIVQKIWRDVGQQPDLFAKIDNMLERIRRERGSGSDVLDFKTGNGGMIEAEFLVQALQMRSGVWNTNWHGALSMLHERDLIEKADAAAAAEAYGLLRRCEMALRRFENKSISRLPADPDEQQKLAKRLGYKDAGIFANEYQNARDRIHALYQSYVKPEAA